MLKTNSSIKDIHFQNPRLTRIGVDILSLAELRRRASATLVAPQRLGFHLLLMVDTGQSAHFVDFVELALNSGSVVFVRSGQVQQWLLDESLQGHLVLITEEALNPASSSLGSDMALIKLDEWPTHSKPEISSFGAIKAELMHLKQDVDGFDSTEIQAALIKHRLLVLLLRLAQSINPVAAQLNRHEANIYRLFAKELEQHFSKRLTVLDYAKRLGYSQSTLSRASVAVVGYTAKEAIDRRIALEAKRLLVHSDTTVTFITHELGFGESTNFIKFFKRREGITPLEYRARILKNTSSG